MNSLALGSDISAVEITHISSHGLWLLVGRQEFFMSYNEFPWFKNQPVNAILAVEEVSCGHFFWPMIDVDLTLAIIENPERFPLMAATQ